MRTYTADEVDAMIGRALAREREALAEQPAQNEPAYQYLLEQNRQMTAELARLRAVSSQALEALEDISSHYMSLPKKGCMALAAIEEALAEQPAQQQEPVQTEPNFEQRKQILDNLERCHHRDSKHEFLRVWIRDWTNHKLSKQTPPRKPWVGLTDEDDIIGMARDAFIVRYCALPVPESRIKALAEAIEAKLKEKNA